MHSARPTRVIPVRSLALSGFFALALAMMLGCESRSFLDPSEVAGARKHYRDPLVVNILNSVDPAIEEPNVEFINATDPRPEDLQTPVGDYVISKNDLLSVSISDLQMAGVDTIKTTRVSESGNISLPYIGVIHAEGLTEIELEQKIVEAYRQADQVLRAQVSVSVIESRGRTFSILGAVAKPNQYVIYDSEFRLLDALVIAGDTTSPLIEDLYIIRKQERRPPTTAPAGESVPQTGPTPEDLAPPMDDLAPHGGSPDVVPGTTSDPDDLSPDHARPSTETSVEPENDRMMTVDGEEVPLEHDAASPTTHENGNWDQMLTADQSRSGEPTTRGFEFNELAEQNVRVIRIPVAELKRGDLRYNVAILPKDQIIVPQLPIGEYYMGGHVGIPGAFSLTARKITLKQAVISARMLDQLAIPSRTDVIRRLGPNREVFVRVDLDKVFAGEIPDLYLKPDDQVIVGTNAIAPFLAAARGAFRLTYGFGFLYDRNFNNSNNGNGF